MNIDINAFERFVLEAAAKTYAAGVEPEMLHTLPGAKLLCYSQPPLWYRDLYFTSPVGVSFGLTTAGHVRLPKLIWWMSYDGWYDRSDPRITQFLRAALRASCHTFNGGRGPSTYTSPDFNGLIYYNNVTGDGFTRFSGRDMIVLDCEREAEKRERYWHEYRGGALV